jgi:three-Cys-motif partner protein
MKNEPNLQTAPLFPDLPEATGDKVRRYSRVSQNIWTEHKAKFIAQYLKFFVQITKHGAYIDGFAGPQYSHKLDAWTASLVLDNEPKWLRTIILCDLKKNSFRKLRRLVESQNDAVDKKGKKMPRRIQGWPGDFNLNVDQILAQKRITQKEATFCLLDQRTFECHWSTVVKLAAYKQPPNHKIEMLYFLGVGWLHRAFSGVKHEKRMSDWWGKEGWRELRKKTAWQIAEIVRNRFETELGYKHTAAYPIFDSEKGNKVMYYMLHASDHKDAPSLMVRAHRKAVRSLPKEKQSDLFVREEANIR